MTGLRARSAGPRQSGPRAEREPTTLSAARSYREERAAGSDAAPARMSFNDEDDEWATADYRQIAGTLPPEWAAVHNPATNRAEQGWSSNAPMSPGSAPVPAPMLAPMAPAAPRTPAHAPRAVASPAAMAPAPATPAALAPVAPAAPRTPAHAAAQPPAASPAPAHVPEPVDKLRKTFDVRTAAALPSPRCPARATFHTHTPGGRPSAQMVVPLWPT